MSYTSDFTSRRERLKNNRHSKGFFTARFWRSLAFILVGMALGFAFHQHYQQQAAGGNPNALSQATTSAQGELTSIASAQEYTDVVRESVQLPERKIA